MCLPPKTVHDGGADRGGGPAAGRAPPRRGVGTPPLRPRPLPRRARRPRRPPRRPRLRPPVPRLSCRSAAASSAAPAASSIWAGQTATVQRQGSHLVVRLAGDDGGRALAAHALRLPDGADHRVVLHQARGREPRQGRRAGDHLRARHHSHVHCARDGDGAAGRGHQPEPLRREPVGEPPHHGHLHRVRPEPVRRLRPRPAAGAGQQARLAHAEAGRQPDAGHAADGADLHAHVLHRARRRSSARCW